MRNAFNWISRVASPAFPQLRRVGRRKSPRRGWKFEVLEARQLLTHVNPIIDTGSLTFLAGGKGSFTDQDGDTYSVKLTGAGKVAVLLSDPDANGKGPIDQIIVQNTSSATSTLTITVTKALRGDGAVSIGRVAGSELKTLTASNSDLVGEGVRLSGFLGTLTVRDILNGAHVESGGTASQQTQLTARVIGDGAIVSLDSAIGTLKAVQFGTGQLKVPSLGTLTIKGDTKLNAAADFNADIELSGQGVQASKNTLGTATIPGVLRGTTNVHGNAGTLTIGTIRGTLNITGNAKSVVVKEALRVNPGAAGATGTVQIQGTGKVQGNGGANLTFTNATLFTAPTAAYRVEDLRRYDQINQEWNYDTSFDTTARIPGFSIPPVRGTGTSTIATQTDSDNPNGYCASVTGSLTDGETAPSVMYCYLTDANGTHATGVRFTNDAADSKFTYTSSPLLAPVQLEQGQLFKGTSPLGGTFDGSGISDEVTSVTLSGTVTVTMKIVGLEQVRVPLGQYLAVKMEITSTINGTATATLSDDSTLKGTITASFKQTVWAVPNVGVVMGVTEASMTLGVPLLGTASLTLKETQKLTSFSSGS